MDDSKRVGTVVFLEFFCLSFLVISLCNVISDAACLESERQALMRFKQDLTDASDLLASWSSNGGNCCDWTGIVCDNVTGRVVELRLGNLHNPRDDTAFPGKPFERSRLSGKVDSLLGLKHLRYVDLSGNNFGVRIPGFLGSLHNLRYLNLSNAGFEGSIPAQLGNLTNVQYLDLHDTLSDYLYAENLQWLTNLSNLKHLDLSGITLSKASDWFEVTNALPSLNVLRLSDCDLDPFPPLKTVNFSTLRTLDLSYNTFSNSIFSWISTLTSLFSLDLRHNSFRGHFPDSLRNMTSLTYLSLSSNQFNSSIPSWLYGLNHLQYLNLGSNNLQGTISEHVGNLTSAVSLIFDNNNLEGAALRSLGNLCSLTNLVLSGVRLSQDISQVLESLSGCLSDRLESLFLVNCILSGHLGNQLGLFRNLRSLYLTKNSISGPIPDSLRTLASLREVDISENRFNGSLPEWLGEFKELEVLWIGKNMLQGAVSEVHFSNLTSLRSFQASGNHGLSLRVSPGWIPPFQLGVIALSSWNLGPRFPHWLRSQKDFLFLDISVAGINDTIPDWFWNLSSEFFYMNISHNQIQGNVAEVLNTNPPAGYESSIDLSSNFLRGTLPCLSSNVGTLDLSNNSFSGSMSPLLCCKMEEAKSLGTLHLAYNSLSGPIPDCWMSWPSIFSMDLKNNNLSGSLPSSMGSLIFLQSLHLRKNNLSGVLPPTLQNCSSLLALDLSENKFEGSIPSWIGEKLSKIMIVGLRSNNFQGDIPRELCALSSLTILDLGHNNLSGKIPECFNNFSAMVSKRNSSDPISYSFGHFMHSIETTLVVIKGVLLEYSSTLRLVTSVDLSDNELSGEIPVGITDLLGLRSLNLSTNRLSGRIPQSVGNMGTLESLDFSFNQLSGAIPSSISNLTFLSYLNVAYNNLMGEIPKSTQLQTFDASNFVGNNLCGPPLSDNCSINALKPHDAGNREGSEGGLEVDWFWFYVSATLGFVVAFWSIAGPLLFKRSWRHAYFKMLDSIGTKARRCFRR
ncbi:putative Disease resistance family protein / LRR family protein [Hibiscus syriacus]|uniref:Disease resistance family protein / LRR family protein n=1 Tax=Hibiscus syriacus TaxID=106335 RepID=A0A6A2YIL4_HIBSY|nr:receptor-like protein EIX1 [Hibiscus syriacus]KAE8675374.1 putative Disease resistance family protein / LRR family protein [Hibiscus syriacus]